MTNEKKSGKPAASPDGGKVSDKDLEKVSGGTGGVPDPGLTDPLDKRLSTGGGGNPDNVRPVRPA